MKFPYTKVTDFPKHQRRQRLLPWIRVGIFNTTDPSRIVYPLGLIDSGADVTIVDRELGEELRINIEKGKKLEIKGVGGGTIHGFLDGIGFVVQNPANSKDIIKYQDLVVFTKGVFPASMPQQTAIWGTVGFFRRLIVTLIYPKQIILETQLS